MAYLHCHTKDCGWSQDDFWDKSYNPFTRTWNDIKWLWKPKWIGLDKWIIDDMTEYTGVKVKVREIKKEMSEESALKSSRSAQNRNDLYSTTYYEFQVFSWQWLWLELVAEWKNIQHMKWWTWKSWKKARDNAVCPKCGERNFDID